MDESRRKFLRDLGKLSVLALATRGVVAWPRGLNTGPIDLLVVGDSFIWGQGLEEKEKFYTHIAEWLRREAFGHERDVRINVQAHSGSTIKLHENEAEAFKKAGRTEADRYEPEVNVGFPSIWHQVNAAKQGYASVGNESGADIVLVSGGITDISVAKLLDPNGDPKLLPPMIEKYCGDDMSELLEHAGSANPNALLVVIGYFPILSPKSDAGKVYNGWLEAMGFPRALKSFANNPLTRSMFFRGIRDRTINRSRIWVTESNRQLINAVERFNQAAGKTRAIFVPSPITEDTCYETPNTLLFRMGSMGRSEDPLFRERLAQCRSALPQLKRSTGLDYPVRYCEIAAIGHPNAAGSVAYATAIKAKLTQQFAAHPL